MATRGAFQDALHARRDVRRRVPWPAALAAQTLEALNSEVLQSMWAGPVKMSMQTMMAVVEREFTDGEGDYTHGELIEQNHKELDVIHQAKLAR